MKIRDSKAHSPAANYVSNLVYTLTDGTFSNVSVDTIKRANPTKICGAVGGGGITKKKNRSKVNIFGFFAIAPDFFVELTVLIPYNDIIYVRACNHVEFEAVRQFFW